MDDAEFLEAAAARLPSLLADDLRVVAVRPDRGRSWLRAEARFEVRGRASAENTSRHVSGSAFAPLDEDWRYLSGYERSDDYAGLLAGKIRSAAHELVYPSPRLAPPTGPAETALRWQWLLERLALSGRVLEQEDGSIRVLRDEGGEFTVYVTPEQWAQIAAPIDPYSDDPEDFNQLDDEAFLVFYEDSMQWSIRVELPPVPFGAEFKRAFREARERGEDMSQYGWFAYHSLDRQHDPYSNFTE